MTKKSYARLQRDATKNEMEQLKRSNKCWDDLEELFQSFSQALVSANSQLTEIYLVPNMTNFIPRKDETITMLRGLSRDIAQFGNDLQVIHSLHAGRTGGFSEEQDMVTSMEIFEKYTNYQVQYDAVIMPTVTFLLEQAELAFAKMSELSEQTEEAKKHKAEADLLNPNVVSDVVVKNGDSNE